MPVQPETRFAPSKTELELLKNRAALLLEAGNRVQAVGETEIAQQRYEKSIVLYRQLGDLPGLAEALFQLGNLITAHGDYEAARPLLRESLDLRRGLGDKDGSAYCLLTLGLIERQQNHYADARRLLEESLDLMRRLGDQQGEAMVLNNLGYAALALGEYALAQTHFSASSTLFKNLEIPWGVAGTLNDLAHVARNQGDIEKARDLYEASLAEWRALGHKAGVAWALRNLGYTLQSQGQSNQAAPLLQEALTLFQELNHRDGMAWSLLNLAYIAHADCQTERAYDLLFEAIRLFEVMGNLRGLTECLIGLAHIVSAQGHYVQAIEYLATANTWLATSGVALTPTDRNEYEHLEQTLKDNVDEAVYREAWEAGCSTSVEQATLKSLDSVGMRGQEKPSLPSPSWRYHNVCIFSLGPVQIYRKGTLLAAAHWRYSKAQELLFYLLCVGQATKEQIGLALWPDVSPAQLRRHLHRTLRALRQALGYTGAVIFEADAYAFNRQQPYWFDVEKLEEQLELISQSRVSESSRVFNPSNSLQTLKQLYHGDFLADLDAGEWATLMRERLRQQYLAALVTLGQYLLEQEDYKQAISAFRHAITHDSYLEAAYRGVMICLVRMGETAQAVCHYHDLAKHLDTELGVQPSNETVALYERIRVGGELEL